MQIRTFENVIEKAFPFLLLRIFRAISHFEIFYKTRERPRSLITTDIFDISIFKQT